jgi:hypothetical protein
LRLFGCQTQRRALQLHTRGPWQLCGLQRFCARGLIAANLKRVAALNQTQCKKIDVSKCGGAMRKLPLRHLKQLYAGNCAVPPQLNHLVQAFDNIWTTFRRQQACIDAALQYTLQRRERSRIF